MSFTGGTNLGSAYGVVKIGSELKGVDDAEKSLKTFSAQAEAAAKKVSAQFKAIGDAAKKAGQVLSVSVTAPLVLAGKKAISAASDLNEALSATDVVFAQSAKRVQAFADTTDDAFGISETAALSAAVQYSVFGKQAGLTGDALADFSTQLVANSADLASFFNTDPTEALNAFRSGLSGEMEPLRRYGIILSEDAVKQKAYAEGIAAQGEELTQGQKVMARYLLIQEQMGDAQGDFSRTSEGLANSLRRLQAIAQDVAADFGQVMLPTVLNIVHRLIDFLKATRDMDPALRALAVKVAVVAAAIGPALIVFGQFVAILSKAGAAAALLTGPIGIILAAIAALALAWKNNWFDIQGIVEKVVAAVGDTIGKLVQFLQHGVDEGFTPWRTALRALIRILSEKFGADSPIVEALQGILRNGEKLGEWVNSSFLNQIRSLKAALLDGDFSRAGAVFQGIWEDIKGGFDRTMGPFLQGLLEFGKDALGGLINGIQQQDWATIGDQLGTSIQAGLARLSEFGAWVLNAIKGVGAGGGGSSSGLVKAQQIGAELTTFLSDRFKEVDWAKLANDLIGGAVRAVSLFLDFQKWRFEKILQLGQFIADRVAEVKWDEVGQKLLDVWRPAWDTFMEGVRTEGAKIAQQVLEAVRDAPWDTVGTQAQSSLQGALAFLNQLGTWIKEQIAGINWDDVGSFLADKIEGAVNGIYAVIRRNLQTLKDFGSWVIAELNQARYADVNNVINQKGVELFNAFVAGVKSKLNDLKVFFEGLSGEAQRWLQNASTALMTRGQELTTGLLHGMQTFWNQNLAPVFKGLIAGLSSPRLFTEAIDGAVKAGAAFIDGLRHGMVDWFNNHLGPEFLDKLPTMISDTLKTLPDKMMDAGIAAIVGLWEGMKKQLEQLQKDFAAWIEDHKPDFSAWIPPGGGDPAGDARKGITPPIDENGNVVKQAHDGGVTTGEAQAEGHIEGLENKTADGEAAAAEFIAKTVDAAGKEQESASPSKVFAQLGQWAGEGYINALNAMRSLAEEAGQRLAQASETGTGSFLDRVKDTLVQKVGEAQSALTKIGTAAQQSASAAVHFQETSDASRTASAADTTDKLTDEEITRAAAVKNFGSDASETSQADLDKRLEAEHDYARASIESERARVKSIKAAQADLEKSVRDANVKRVQLERDLARQLNDIEAQRAEFAKAAEEQLAELADQRAQIETDAAQQRADVESQLQDQLSQAEQQFNDTQQQNLQAQQEARAELASQLQEAADAWKAADAAAVAAIKEIKKTLKETLQQGREEFNRLMQDMNLDASRTEEDFQRNLEDLQIQKQRINEDLSAALVDPKLSPEQRAQARIEAARQLEDLDRRQQDLEIDHQRAIQDAETARHDAEIAHQEEEKAQRDAAHQQILDQKKAQKDAEKAYHDRRLELEGDAATRIGQLQSDLGKAASDLRTTQAGLRDEAVKQIDDIAQQESSSMADLAKREQEIFDERAKNFSDLEDQKTAAFRQAEQDRTVIAREEQKARDSAARLQDQADRNAAKEQRKALRELNRVEDPQDASLAQARGEKFGEAQGQGTATGIGRAKQSVQQAGEDISTAAETGYTSASDPQTLGTDWSNSVIQGTLSRLGGARSAGNQMATALEDGFRDAAEMSSPSRVGLQLGSLFGSSIRMGLDSQRSALADDVGRLVSRQSLARAGVASQIIGEQQRAASGAGALSLGNLTSTVVIEDKQLKKVILGVAISPLVNARERVSSGGF